MKNRGGLTQGRKLKGVCKLTQKTGVFIKSHLIPKALTKPAQKGNHFFQFEVGKPPIRRWSSWYDPYLVTQEGEDILTKLDTWAVLTLREHSLVWSGWEGNKTLGLLHSPIGKSPWGIRKVSGLDPRRLRLFFLSILWRAAATNLPEFADVQLSPEDLEKLRLMIILDAIEPISFYSVQLTQLSTIGEIHNHAPIADTKRILSLDSSGKAWDVPIFRFYFDGLVAHFNRHDWGDEYTAELGNLVVGAEQTLLVSTQTYEDSFQKNILTAVLSGR